MDRRPDFLAHVTGDHVAVAVRDMGPGPALVGYLDGAVAQTLELLDSVPLGHKVALTDLAVGADVIEYELRIAVATQHIRTGGYVHAHNVRSARWQNSVA